MADVSGPANKEKTTQLETNAAWYSYIYRYIIKHLHMRFCHLHLQMSNFPTKTSFIINIVFILFILFSAWGDYYREHAIHC